MPDQTAVDMHLLAASIDGVIAALDDIIDQSRRERSRLGFFAPLYRMVTAEVKRCCADGFFEDNPRMLRLDVAFANRYLDALDRHRQGRRPSESWAVAFDAAQRRRLHILQHLLLGMNAHISLDLGIAVAGISPEGLPDSLPRDFNRLNTILAALTDEVQDKIARVSPLLGFLDRLALRFDESLTSFSIEMARDSAWEVAEQLVCMPPEQRFLAVQARDKSVAQVSQRIANPGLLARPIIELICFAESRSIPRILDALTSNRRSKGF